jgi:hypothetical protein
MLRWRLENKKETSNSKLRMRNSFAAKLELYFCNKFKIITLKGKCLIRQRNLVLHNLHRILF